MNTGAPWPTEQQAAERVLRIQRKLHQWTINEDDKQFDDLFNLVCDPAFLVFAWRRVRGNRGARTAGVDGHTAYEIEARGVQVFLDELRADLKARRFHPLPVRERSIPKPGSPKFRRLGIPTVRDRVVQASLKLVLEPILEADFKPCSYGFRPRRRAQDAIAEIHLLATNSYEWVLDGDIEACFDRIDHTALIGRVKSRIKDKRVLALIKAFLRSGLLSEEGVKRDTITGTPQGGVLSPLLANVALSVLDQHFTGAWEATMSTPGKRAWRRHKGLANYRLIRYADDFVVMVAGDKGQAEQLHQETAAVLSSTGLALSNEKTRIAHIDDGFDFLGFRIQRQQKRGSKGKRHVYTYPSKAALAAIKAKVRAITRGARNKKLEGLLYGLNPVLRGWTTYFRHGVSKVTFNYLSHFSWRRVICWLRRKHPRSNWKQLRRRYLLGWWPQEGKVMLFDPGKVPVTRYRYRGQHIATPWTGLP